mgnify:CR=1 FL=1
MISLKLFLLIKKKKTSILISLDLLQSKYTRNIKIIFDNMVINYDYVKNQLLLHRNYKTRKIIFKHDLNDAYEKQINFFMSKFKRKDKKNLIKYADIISSVKLSKLLFKLSDSNKQKKKIQFKISK